MPTTVHADPTARPTRRRFARQCLGSWLVPAAALASAACGRAPMETAFEVHRDLHYGPLPEHLVDVWRPRCLWRHEAPGVLMIHGGGWNEGVRADMEEALCRWFLNRGFTVANVEYRKAPGTLAPGSILDVRLAASWFVSDAARWRLSTDRVIFCGTSAGGHLALMAALPPADAGFGPAPRPLAIVNLWGVSDLGALLDHPAAGPLVRNWIRPSAAPETLLRMARAYSPLGYVRPGLPTVLSIHSRLDPVVPFSQSQRLDQALRAAGNFSQLVALEGRGHGDVNWATVHSHLTRFFDANPHIV
jgi:acetyl esterase/lipase